MKFLSHGEVIKFRQYKEQSEVRLVQTLKRTFEQSELGRTAQRQVRVLVAKMLHDDLHPTTDSQGRPTTSLANVLNEEDKLRLWDRVGGKNDLLGLVELLKLLRMGKCDLHDCADILRLFGAFAEQGPEKLRAGIEKLRAAKPVDHPLHGAFEKIQSKRTKPGQGKVIDLEERAKQKYRSRGQTGAVMSREELEGKLETMGIDLVSECRAFPIHLEQVFEGQPSPKIASGCNRWSLRLQSKSGQIDKAFGLPFGGDISGTTADSLFGLKVAAELTAKADTTVTSALDFLVLMPLISLVGLYNHTVLECALALTYCGIITDYNIGFYTSLFPKRCSRELYEDVWGGLLREEKSNPKMVVYTRKDLLQRGEVSVLRGLLMEGSQEESSFRSIASVKGFYKDSLDYRDESARVVLKPLLADGLLKNRMSKALEAIAPPTRAMEVGYIEASLPAGALRPAFSSAGA